MKREVKIDPLNHRMRREMRDGYSDLAMPSPQYDRLEYILQQVVYC
jgi:hypothetical protein